MAAGTAKAVPTSTTLTNVASRIGFASFITLLTFFTPLFRIDLINLLLLELIDANGNT